MTTFAIYWNEVYKLAAGKRNNSTQITTLRKHDGSLTADTKKTIKLMLEYFTPENNEYEENDYHKQVRAQSQEAVNSPDDRELL